jgi:hypothetical protein
MVKKALKVSLVPIYNAACMPLLFAENAGLEQRQISLAAIAILKICLSSKLVFNYLKKGCSLERGICLVPWQFLRQIPRYPKFQRTIQ